MRNPSYRNGLRGVQVYQSGDSPQATAKLVPDGRGDGWMSPRGPAEPDVRFRRAARVRACSPGLRH